MSIPFTNNQPTLALTTLVALQGVFPQRQLNSIELNYRGNDGGLSRVGLETVDSLEDAPQGASSLVGQVLWFAGNFAIRGTAIASGQLQPIADNTGLFSVVSTYYGGDGQSTFALPDFGGNLAVGTGQGPGLSQYDIGDETGAPSVFLIQQNLPFTSGGSSQPIDNVQPSLPLNYIITVEGLFPSPSNEPVPIDGIAPQTGSSDFIGMVSLFAGNYPPVGSLICDGRLLSISEYETLFNVIGTTYGGDGQETFALPDLRGRTIIGAGQGPGLNNYELGQYVGEEQTHLSNANMPTAMGGSGAALTNQGPALALNFLVAIEGIFPSRNSTPGVIDGSELAEFDGLPILGEVVAFAGNYVPRGFASASGQQLAINQNQALFSILGTSFGGNGQTTFALPDLRGRSVVGTDSNNFLGENNGQSSNFLTLDNIPPLAITGTDNVDILFGGNDPDQLTGLLGGDSLNGHGGNDTLIGNGGDDVLTGGAGEDVLNGGPGADLMSGGSGNDLYIEVDSTDTISENGNAGTDRVTTGSFYILPDNVEELEQLGSAAISGRGNALDNVLIGNGGGNNLRGLSGNDLMQGLNGNDQLNGDSGNDRIYGGSGRDTIAGGKGKDLAYGGAGADRFVYAAGDISSGLSLAGAERILDFRSSDGDKIDLSAIDANLNGGGNESFQFIASAAFTNVAGQLRFETDGINALVLADVNGDGVADFALRLNGVSSLAATDFVL